MHCRTDIELVLELVFEKIIMQSDYGITIYLLGLPDLDDEGGVCSVYLYLLVITYDI